MKLYLVTETRTDESPLGPIVHLRGITFNEDWACQLKDDLVNEERRFNGPFYSCCIEEVDINERIDIQL